MNRQLLDKYRNRFMAVNKVEEKESKKLTIQQKFQLLSSLFSLGIGLGLGLRKDLKSSLKSNWALLKT